MRYFCLELRGEHTEQCSVAKAIFTTLPETLPVSAASVSSAITMKRATGWLLCPCEEHDPTGSLREGCCTALSLIADVSLGRRLDL